MTITFATGNQQKIKEARAHCAAYGIVIEAQKIKTAEIQTNNIEKVAINKAEQAYAQLKRPLIANDSGWRIPALNGFPGAFMRYVNEWFTPEDFLHLMSNKTDRRIFLIEVIAYHDGEKITTYTHETEGTIADTPAGNEGAPSDKVVRLGRGQQLTIAQTLDVPTSGVVYAGSSVWDIFCQQIKSS
jgi:XTP/dITP diphosphohydrolase